MAGSLPEEATPFLGRRRELAEVRAFLGTTRLLTLTGVAGVGKSRLALAVAGERSRAFPGGVWFTALDGVEDDGDLVTAVAAALGRPIRPGTDAPLATMVRLLREEHLLLVLDGCERLVDGVSQLVEAITRNCPQVRVIATSRVPLRVTGDVVHQVRGLEMPDASFTASARELDASDAVRFFLDRARRSAPSSAFAPDDRERVHELVRRLDRLPLVLECAAAQLASSSLAQLLDQLEDPGAVLCWEHPTPSGRHRTLRANLGASAALCTEDERRLWGRCSVFRGTFDLDAVEAVCGDDLSTHDLLDLVQGLVERSVIVRQDHGAAVRYALPRLEQLFGEELLAESAEDPARLLDAHVRWCFSLVARADADWDTARQASWLERIALEHDNTVRALEVASASPERADAAAAVVVSLWWWSWCPQGRRAEGLAHVRRCAPHVTGTRARSRLLLVGALLAAAGEDLSAADALLVDARAGAVALATTASSGSIGEPPDPLLAAVVEHVTGVVALARGEPAGAAAHLRTALAVDGYAATREGVDARLLLALVLTTAGDCAAGQAACAQALTALAPAEQLQRSYALLLSAESHLVAGETEAARRAAVDALLTKARLSDPFGLAWTAQLLAEIDTGRRRLESAALLAGAAGRLWQSMGGIPALGRLRARATAVRGRLHDGLGPAAWREVRRRGRELSLEEVVAIAVADGVRPAAQATATGTLTPRERQIAALVALGLTNRQIAERLVVAHRTVDAHVQNILTKLAFTSRAQIAAWTATRPEG